MEWIEAFVNTTQEGLEMVSGFLYQCGLTGLIIEDETDFKDFLENAQGQWDYIEESLIEEKTNHPTGITFFVRDNVYGKEQIADIKSGLDWLKASEKEFDLGELSLTLKNIKEQDWANHWKKYFKPFEIGEKIMIKPSWEELKEPTDKKVLQIDPGHIFGTGTHETTQLCIEQIEKYLKQGDTVFDIGCGSGILSIASLLLGAQYAHAIDIDKNAVEIAYENARMNHITKDNYHVASGNIIEDIALAQRYKGKGYDVVEANIVADIIISLAKIVPDFIKPKGIFITSGIIKDRLLDVYDALLNNGFQVIETAYKKDWAVVVSQYK